MQDPGWSDPLPTGRGLLSFSTTEEAVEGLAGLAGDYGAHARAAREIADTYFAAERVLPPFGSESSMRIYSRLPHAAGAAGTRAIITGIMSAAART